ncbi:unnamed protein product [Larinioides sclopetarius]|uniref:Uncharacterized protein n=1 Tax=Larinioides sclopetarius TaxID=280406 RepID=A0AAV2B3F2_9ARAC
MTCFLKISLNLFSNFSTEPGPHLCYMKAMRIVNVGK